MSEVDHNPIGCQQGPNNKQPSHDWLPSVYDELRKLAASKLLWERPDHTLNATALVHEAYLRLGGEASFGSKSHFLRAAAEAMRRILVDHARKKRADKRGGMGQRFALSENDLSIIPDQDTILTIDETLTALAETDAGTAELARLRLFVGVTIEEAADALGISRATAFRDWSFARAYLSAALQSAEKSRND
jgi:RNA polymerase sigma factor (TIGR02999 family)